jgi:hypothetical protein
MTDAHPEIEEYKVQKFKKIDTDTNKWIDDQTFKTLSMALGRCAELVREEGYKRTEWRVLPMKDGKHWWPGKDN